MTDFNCPKCGTANVRWAQSAKSGKWYLQKVKVWTSDDCMTQRVYPNGLHTFAECNGEQESSSSEGYYNSDRTCMSFVN